MADVEVFKDIPGYKAILKAVLKNQIQILVEQLSETTGEESLILTASISDGSFSHLGSQRGKIFLQKYDNIKSQFLGFCLTGNHSVSSTDDAFDEQYHHGKAYHSRNDSALSLDSQNLDTEHFTYEIGHSDLRNEKQVKKKRRKSFHHDEISNLPKLKTASQETAEREDDIRPVSLFVKREPDAETDTVDTNSDSGTTEFNSQTSDHTSGARDQMVDDSDLGMEYRQEIGGHVQDMFHTTGIYRNTELPKYNGVTVNNTLDLSKAKTENPSGCGSQLMDTNSESSGKTSFGLATGISELDSLESQVQALETEIQAHPLKARFLANPSTFSCTVCLKGFKNEADLNYHEKTHHKIKKYTCDICSKAFTRKFNMDTHRQLHFEVRQHNCKFCNKGYTRRDRLLMHYQSSHSAELGIDVKNLSSADEKPDTSAASL